MLRWLQGPKFMRKLNGWLAIFWLTMIPISVWFGWVEEVVFVSALSLYAAAFANVTAWQNGRFEEKQEQDSERQAIPIRKKHYASSRTYLRCSRRHRG